jgi:hypothetical protein
VPGGAQQVWAATREAGASKVKVTNAVERKAARMELSPGRPFERTSREQPAEAGLY